MTNLTKKQALEMFGGDVQRLATAMGTTRQAIYQWPDELSDRLTKSIVGAAVLAGVPVGRFLAEFKREVER